MAERIYINMEKQYICSERAHFMCPNMHFGILADIKGKLNAEKIRSCFNIMAQAHPFLRSVIRYESNSIKLYYQIEDESQVEIKERESFHTIWEDYKSIAVKEWDVLHHGLLKVFIYPMKRGMRVLFIAHHLLGDGRCLLELVNEFVNLYIDAIEPVYAPERVIQGIKDLPYQSDLTGVSKCLVKYLNQKWRNEKKQVTYEAYARFSDQFVKENPVSHEVISMDQKSFYSMKKYCKEHGITINDFLMSKMYFEMKIQKIIIAADVRSKLACYKKGSYGNYATAMGIVIKNKHTDMLKKAKEVHKQVKIHTECNRKLMLVLSCYLNMEEGLIDAAAIATLGDFESKAAKFVGGNMFGFLKRDSISITNLGNFSNQYISEAIFIPPASPAASQTIGVLTVNDKMQLCSSYYKNSISRLEVKKQLTSLVRL